MATRMAVAVWLTAIGFGASAGACSTDPSRDRSAATITECYGDEFGLGSGGSGSQCVVCEAVADYVGECDTDCGGENSYPSCGCEDGPAGEDPPGDGSGSGSDTGGGGDTGSGSDTGSGGLVGPRGGLRSTAPIPIVAEVIYNGTTPVRIVVSAGTEFTQRWITITAADIAANGQISASAGTQVRAAMNALEGRVMSAGRTVGAWQTTGFRFGIGALFFLALQGSAMAGQYAAGQVSAWTTANNRGENCSKLARWLASDSRTQLTCSTSNCEDCYALKINTIPSNLTAQTCYADIAAVTGAVIPAIETQVNARAQAVVGHCGGLGGRASSWIPWRSARRGGYLTTTPVGTKPPFDGVNVPAMTAVCPRVY